jgi:hypothetical protein
VGFAQKFSPRGLHDAEVIPISPRPAYVCSMKNRFLEIRPTGLAATTLAAATLVVALLAAPARSQDLPDNLIRAELLPGWQTDAGTRMAALRLTLAPGWKTYWRAPGEAGIPPQFNWTGSANVASVAYHWPRPAVFDLNGMRILGYKDQLVLPIEFAPVKPGQPVTVTGHVDLGVCDNICVPVSVDIAGELSSGTRVDPLIRSALALGPDDGARAGIATPVCVAAPIRDGLRLNSRIKLPGAQTGDFAVVELADTSVWVSSVESQAGNGSLTEVSDLVPSSAKPFALDRSSLRFTIFQTNGKVYELSGCTG